MKVLVLGGAGFVGQELVRQLLDDAALTPVVASRRPVAENGVQAVSVDARDESALVQILDHVEVVVNCIMGDGPTIAGTAASIAAAARKTRRQPLIIHLSTQSVYGSQVGRINEQFPRIDDIGWYGAAKIRAEQEFEAFAEAGGRVFILRPGCIYGPGSDMWTRRICRLIVGRSLGDLGNAGDGWSNLVYVADVARAVVCCLKAEIAPGQARVYNLSAPDSPRWNRYFHDVALELEATPFRYLPRHELFIRSKLLAPPLKVTERVLRKLRMNSAWLPDGMPSSLLGVLQQQIHLSSAALERDFTFCWTPYMEGLALGCRWYQSKFV